MEAISREIQRLHGQTVFVYLLVIFLSTFFAAMYQNKKGYRHSVVYLRMSFLCIWIMLAFSTCGTDYPVYKVFFEESLTASRWVAGDMERGFLLFMAIVRIFTSDFRVFHVIWATVMLMMIYKTLQHYMDQIHMGIAMFVFSSLYCIQSMNLMRMFFAASIVFYAIRFLIKRNFLKYTIFVLVAACFHVSSVIMILPMIFLKLFSSQKRYFIKTMAFILSVLVVFIFREKLFGASILGYSHGLIEGGSFGVANIIYHLPLFLLFYYSKKTKHANQEINRVFFVLMMTSLAVGVLSYYISLIGRMYVYFASIYVLFPAYYLCKNVDEGKFNRIPHRNILTSIFLVVICLRLFMSIEYFESDGTLIYTWIFNQ